jgi:hypothetical protein
MDSIKENTKPSSKKITKKNTNKKDDKRKKDNSIMIFRSYDWYHKTIKGRAALNDLDSVFFY